MECDWDFLALNEETELSVIIKWKQTATYLTFLSLKEKLSIVTIYMYLFKKGIESKNAAKTAFKKHTKLEVLLKILDVK